jgi:hypothetical protein
MSADKEYAEITEEERLEITEHTIRTIDRAIENLQATQQHLRDGKLSLGIGRMGTTGQALHELGVSMYFLDQQEGWPLFGGDPHQGEHKH